MEKEFDQPTETLIRKLLEVGINTILLSPTVYMGDSATPTLFMSYKQFSNLIKEIETDLPK